MLKSNYYTEPTEIDRLIFLKLVPANHYLRQVLAVIDFERFREQVKLHFSGEVLVANDFSQY